jgi:hypothetical protein
MYLMQIKKIKEYTNKTTGEINKMYFVEISDDEGNFKTGLEQVFFSEEKLELKKTYPIEFYQHQTAIIRNDRPRIEVQIKFRLKK